MERKGKARHFLFFLSKLLGVVVILILLIPQQLDAAVPKIISYQGRLTDSDGDLLGGSSGTNYYFRFAIYAASTGGTALWPATTPAAITATVTDGVFNINIGDSGNTCDGTCDLLTLDFNDSDVYYLEIRVASQSNFSDGETLTPRQRITSSGYAINATTVDGAHASTSTGANAIPITDGSGIINLTAATAGITATSTNPFTIQGQSSGDIRFFSSSNALTSAGNLTIAGNATVSGTGTSTFAGGIAVDTSDFVVIPGTGRVGIGGVTEPLYNLQVSGNSYFQNTLGIGIAPVDTATLKLNRTSVNTGAEYGILSTFTTNPTITGTSAAGMYLTTNGGGTAARDHIAGIQNIVQAALSGGSLNWVYGSVQKTSVSQGTVINTVNTLIQTPVIGGNITNNYGIFIENQRNGASSTNYSIYSEGGDALFLNSSLITQGGASQSVNLFEAKTGGTTSSTIAWINPSGGIGSSGTSYLAHTVPSMNNAFDFGSPTSSWRNIYASTSLNVSSGAASTTISGSGNISTTGNYLGGSGSSDKRITLRGGTDTASINLAMLGMAHGMTDEVPTTDTYGYFRDANGVAGGMSIVGAAGTGLITPGLIFYGLLGNADPTDSTPALLFEGSKKSGTTRQAMGADETVIRFRTGVGTNLLTILGSGDTLPGTANAQNLGSFVLPWRNIYASTSIMAGSGSTSSTLAGATLNLFSGSSPDTISGVTTGITIQNSSNPGVNFRDPASDIEGEIFVSASANQMYAGTVTATDFGLMTDGTTRWTVKASTGYLVPATNNLRSIGAFGNAVKDIYASSSLNVSSGAASTTISSSGNITLSGVVQSDSTSGTSTFASGIAVDTTDFVILPGTGRIGIGTANPVRTLTVAAAGADGGSQAWSYTGMAHGMTVIAPTDAYATIGSNNVSSGGLMFQGISSAGDSQGITMRGVIGNADPTDTVAAIRYVGAKKDGTTIQALGNSETVFQLANNLTTIFTALGSGDILPGGNNSQNLGATGTAWKDVVASGTVYANRILLPNGSVASPSYSFAGNNNEGFYTSGADLVAATDDFIIRNTGDSLTIGRFNTSYATFGVVAVPNVTNTLDLGMFGQAWRTLYASSSVLVGSGAASTTISNSGNITLSGIVQSDNAAGTSTFAGGLTIEGTGFVYDYQTNSVGINTAPNTQTKLYVNGNQSDSGQYIAGFGASNVAGYGKAFYIYVTAGTPEVLLTTGAAGTDPRLSFSTGGAAAQMTLTLDGNLGIGTTTPAEKLAVVGRVSASLGLLASSTSYLEHTVPSINNAFDFGSPTSSWRNVYASGTLTIGTPGGTTTSTFLNGANFAVSGGNVGIGTSTPRAKLDVGGILDIEGYQAQNFPKAYSGNAFTAFGDSITVGVGASPQTTNGYAYLIAAETGMAITDQGYSSKEFPDILNERIYPTAVANNGRFTVLSGFNDMSHNGTSVAGLNTYEETLRAGLAWLAIPSANRIQGNDASITYSGTWSDISLYSGSISSKYSTTNGDTASVTLYGSAIYVGYTNRTGQGAGVGGTFSVTVDGVNYGTVDTSYGVTPNSGALFWGGMFRVGNLIEGPHTVLMTVTSANGRYVNIDWLGSNDDLQGWSGPFVYAGNTLRKSVAGCAAGGVLWNKCSDTAVELYNKIQRKIVSELAADGLNVVEVDASRYFNPNESVQVDVDGIHPSNTGHSNIARAFITAINGIPSPRAVQGGLFADQLAQYFKLSASNTISIAPNSGAASLFSIGTTFATSTLTVYNSSNSSGPWLTIGNGAASTTIGGYSVTATTTNPYGAVFANLGGNMGIGLETPSAALHVANNGELLRLSGYVPLPNSYYLGVTSVVGPSTVDYRWRTVDSTGGTQDVLFFDGSSGYVGIGTTGITVPTEKLSVVGRISASLGLLASGTTYLEHTVPSLNNAFDLGSPTSSWRNVYASGTINSGGTLLISDGSAAAPSIVFSNDPDTGIYSAADGSVTLSSDGVILADFRYDNRWLFYDLSGTNIGIFGEETSDNTMRVQGMTGRRMGIVGSQTDSATAINVIIGGTYEFSSVGAKTLSIQNLSTSAEEAFFGAGASNPRLVLQGRTSQIGNFFEARTGGVATNTVAWINPSGGFGSSGTSYLAHTVPSLNNAFDLGSGTSSWRNIYASGTVRTAGSFYQDGSAGIGGYLRTNAKNLYSGSNLNPGILIYGDDSGVATYGMDMGYNSTVGRYRNRLFFYGTAADFAFSYTNALPATAQSDFADIVVIRGDSGNMGIATVTPQEKLSVVGRVSASQGLLASGTTYLEHTVPSLNNAFDLGSATSSWRDVYASGTLRASSTLVGTGKVGAPTISFLGDEDTGIYSSSAGTLNFTSNGTQRMYLNSNGNLLVDLIDGLSGAPTITHLIIDGTDAVSLRVRAGNVSGPNIQEWQNTAGTAILAWVNQSGGFGASGTSYLAHTVPSINNAFDLGSPTSSWRNIYASTSLNVSTVGGASSSLSSGNVLLSGKLLPSANNTSDIGAFGTAFKDVYVSGTIRVGNGAASTTIGKNFTTNGSIYPASTGGSYLGEYGHTFQEIWGAGLLRMQNAGDAYFWKMENNVQSFANTAAIIEADPASDVAGANMFLFRDLNTEEPLKNPDARIFRLQNGPYASTTRFDIDPAGKVMASSSYLSRGQFLSTTSTINSFQANNTSGVPIFWVSTTGGIGSSGTSYLAHTVSSLNNAFDLGSGTSSWRNIYASGTLIIGGQISVSSTATSTFQNGINLATGCFAVGGTCVAGPGADLAEMYETKEGVEAGDIVAMSEDSFYYEAGWGQQKITVLEKATTGSRVVGVVSVAPAINIGNELTKTAQHPQPIALAGRTLVKVSLENGPIKAGDFLGPSSVPGVAAKMNEAGMGIGAALEDYAPPEDGSIGKVMIFVHTQYSSGAWLKNLFQKEGMELSEEEWVRGGKDVSKLILASLLSKKEQITNSTQISEIFTGRVVAGLEVITPLVVTKDLVVDTVQPRENNLTLLLGDNDKFIIPFFASSALGSATSTDYATASSTPGIAVSFDAFGNGFFAGEVRADKISANSIAGLEIITDKLTYLSDEVMSSSTYKSDLGADSFAVDGVARFNGLATFATSTGFYGPANFGAGLDVSGDVTIAGGMTVSGKLVAGNLESPEIAELKGAIDSLSINFETLKAEYASSTASSAKRMDEQAAVLAGVSTRLAEVESVTQNRTVTLEDLLGESGALEVAGATVLSGGLKVDSIGAIGAELSLISDTVFFGRPYFTTDTAGFALVGKGQKYVDVIFDREYLEQPIVNATITFNEDERRVSATSTEEIAALDAEERAFVNGVFQSGIQYIVNRKGNKGFRILLNNPATEDINFSWTALAVRGAKTFSMKEEETSNLTIQQFNNGNVDGGGGNPVVSIDGGAASGTPIDGGIPTSNPQLPISDTGDSASSTPVDDGAGTASSTPSVITPLATGDTTPSNTSGTSTPVEGASADIPDVIGGSGEEATVTENTPESSPAGAVISETP